MDRRTFVRLLGLAGAAGGVMGHSPYRQWQVYRKSRLIIVTSAADPASHPLGETVATLLVRHLPETRALATRAGDSLEIVKLLASNQLDLAILPAPDARDARLGSERRGARRTGKMPSSWSYASRRRGVRKRSQAALMLDIRALAPSPAISGWYTLASAR